MTQRCISIPLPVSQTPLSSPAPLDARLEAAVAFVRGGVVADVGTDHAYLPISLLCRKRCDFVIATDIHRGPAEVAAAHLSACGIENDRAAVLLTDGLHGAERFSPTDICILGMGGEMITHIIDEAPWVKNSFTRLILQPMTRAEHLRRYLDEHGFVIREEQLVKTDRIYQIICAEYDGRVRTHTPLSLLLGELNIARRNTLCIESARRQQKIFKANRAEKLKGENPDTTKEDLLLAELAAFLSDESEESTS